APYGHYKKPYFPENEIRAFAEKATRATFICASYDETLALLVPGDVIYCDPPYDGTFSNYHTAGFTQDDQYQLASILERRASE
ncbi:DNA adenine methylase, partial [Klebsiella pneumoniae]